VFFENRSFDSRVSGWHRTTVCLDRVVAGATASGMEVSTGRPSDSRPSTLLGLWRLHGTVDYQSWRDLFVQLERDC